MASKAAPADLEIAPHPVQRSARVLWALALFFAFGTIGLAWMGPVFEVPAFPLAIAAVLGALAGWTSIVGRAVQAHNKAYNWVATGRLDDAEALLERHARAIRWSGYGRALDLQRATIAYRRGDLARTLERCDAALARRRSWTHRIWDDGHRDLVAARRSLARAATGDLEGARRDGEELRGRETVQPETLAIVELAEALALERSEQGAALRDHLARRSNVLRWLSPRERALVRALRRKLDRERTTVYRSAAVREEDRAQEPALADWMDSIAPGTGAFAPRAARATTTAEPATDEHERVDAAALAALKRGAAKPRRSLGWRVFVLWALLIVMFLAIWQFLSPDAASSPPTPTPEVESPLWSTWIPWAIPAGLLLMVIGLVAFRVRGLVRAHRELAAARRAVAVDDPGGAERIARLAAKAPPAIGAYAAHFAADLADERCDIEGALAAAEAGIARISTRQLETATGDFVLPNLWADRAFAKLVLGRRDDALAEMALLGERFPSFPYLGRATFRVQLVDRLRRGDFARAAELAPGAHDLPIPPREELLADLARALGDPIMPEIERTRVHAELRGDEASARWIRRVAPEALDAFGRADRASGADLDAAVETEAQAQAEALAEEEARAAEALRDARTRTGH